MKDLMFWVGILFLIMAALATPIAIGIGLYDWVGNDAEFKFALWFGFKAWISMLALGLIVGFPCFIMGK
jgi:hypothetical protein